MSCEGCEKRRKAMKKASLEAYKKLKAAMANWQNKDGKVKNTKA